MELFSTLFGIVTNGIGILQDHLKSKRELKAAQVQAQIDIERIKVSAAEQRATEGALHEIKWETSQVDASKSSWKDEYFSVVLSIPFLAAAFGYPEAAQRAFDAFASAPEWYTYSFLVAVGSSFGVRIWQKVKT